MEQIGKYRVIKKLGDGGFGSVYKAEDTILGLEVALKILHPHIAADEMLFAYFKREALALARLQHINILRFFTFEQIGDQNFIVMEFIDGKELDEYLGTGLPDWRQVVRIFIQILAGLDIAHKHNIIHRDIKPANIMVTNQEEVKLTDFGIAKLTDTAKLTKTGTGAGSLLYMSPEQIKGSQDIDSRSDIYSLGITLYEILTCTTPFEADSDYQIMEKQLKEVPKDPTNLNANIPERLKDIVMKALEKKPNDRFQSAEEMKQALAALLNKNTNLETKLEPVKRRSSDETVIISHPQKNFGYLKWLIPVVLVVGIAGVVGTKWSDWFVQEGKKIEQALVNDSDADGDIDFKDSLLTADELYADDNNYDAYEVLRILSKSKSANDKNRLLVFQKLAVVSSRIGDTLTVDKTFAEIHKLKPKFTFKADKFPKEVVTRWESYLNALPADIINDVEDKPVVAQKGSISVNIKNYQRFEPVKVLFDGISVEYKGQALQFDDLKNKTYEITVITDVGWLVDTARVFGKHRTKEFTLSEQFSDLLIAAPLNEDGNTVFGAEVTIDDLEASIMSNGTIEPPKNISLMNGSHKIMIKHADYKITNSVRYIRVPQIEEIDLKAVRK